MEAGQTSLLIAGWQDGHEAARDELWNLLFDDLKRVASARRRAWNGDLTLNTTALLGEFYLRVSECPVGVSTRGEFLSLASKAMRHVLVDYAKAKNRHKRGGATEPKTLYEELQRAMPLTANVENVMAIDQALRQIELINPRLVQVVELRFYGGLNYNEIAEALEITKRTVIRDWVKARAFLLELLND